MKISILVPVYNAEKYIERCARSLFEQTYDDIEYIFVNDYTPDKSIEILKSILLRYPQRQLQTKIINHEKNQGVAATRNTLIEHASGDYILWVDADDYIANNAIDILVKKAIANNADIVCFGTLVCSVYGNRPLALFDGANQYDLIIDLLSGRLLTVLWGNLIKRKLFTDNNISFIEGLDVGEDMLVLVKLIYYSKIITIEKSILYYYDDTNEHSLVRSFSIEKTLMVIKILDMLENFLNNKINVSTYIVERKLDAYLSIIYGACISGDKYKYKWAKTILSDMDWKHIKNRKSPFYLFFLKCSNYSLNRLWAYMMLFLKHCVIINKRIVKTLKSYII